MSQYGSLTALREETSIARAMLENMKDILGDDAELIQNAVVGETDLPEAIGAALGRVIELNAMLLGLELTAERIKERASRMEVQRDTIKIAIQAAMEAGQMKRFEHPLGTISVKSTPPKVFVSDEASIPSNFWKPSDPKLDKQAIGKALKDGKTVAGATLSNGGTTIQISLR